MFQYQVFSELRDLPPCVIRSFADAARNIAHGLDVAAERVVEFHLDGQRNEAHRRRLQRACRQACDLIDAARQAATRHDVPLASVRLVRPLVWRWQKKRRRIETERKIMVGYRAGLNDREIGDLLGRHPKTVANIRRGVLKEMEGLYGAAIP